MLYMTPFTQNSKHTFTEITWKLRHTSDPKNRNPFYNHHPYLLPQTTNKQNPHTTHSRTKTTTTEEQKSNTLFNQTRSKKSSDNLSVRHFETRMRTAPEEYAEENDRKEFSFRYKSTSLFTRDYTGFHEFWVTRANSKRTGSIGKCWVELVGCCFWPKWLRFLSTPFSFVRVWFLML